MTDKIKTKDHGSVFLENPHDVETIFESLSIASDMDMELIFMDMLIHNLRLSEEVDLVDLSFNIIKKLNEMKIK